MSTVFALLMVASFFTMIYFGGRWGFVKVTHRPNRFFGRNALVALGVMLVTGFLMGMTSPTTDLTPTQATNKIHQAQKLDTTLDAKAKAADKRRAELIKQKKLLLAQVAKADEAKTKAESQRDATGSSIDTAVEKAASASSAAASSSSAAASSRAAEASSQAAVASSQAAASSTAAAQANTNHTAPVNNGDMNTGDAQKIVGNVNSHIYHVPGQAGYRMNSANAVYFDTEQQAIAAGYRKSLR